MRREWEVRKKKEKVRKSVKLEKQAICRCGSLELGP
jgi:CDGSH-type Zn-finger protein